MRLWNKLFFNEKSRHIDYNMVKGIGYLYIGWHNRCLDTITAEMFYWFKMRCKIVQKKVIFQKAEKNRKVSGIGHIPDIFSTQWQISEILYLLCQVPKMLVKVHSCWLAEKRTTCHGCRLLICIMAFYSRLKHRNYSLNFRSTLVDLSGFGLPIDFQMAAGY